MNLRILVAGGGSGGHLYPALAILEGFRARGAERLGYIGARRELERRVLSGYPWIEAYLIHGRGLPRPRPRGRGHTPSWSWRGLFPLGELFLGLIESLIIIFRFRPTVLIGTGGFVSFPPLLWGLIFRIPTVILEVNVIPGLVNRLLAPHVGLVTTAYPETARLLCRSRRAKKLAVTGVPLRPSVLAAAGLSPEESRRALGLDPHKRTVLILGGSRGAGPLNRAVLRSCSREGSNSDNFQVLLISGQDEGEGGPLRRGEGNQGWSVSVRGNGPIVQVRGYLDRIGEALSAT
ncbi:TPA: hypothetical protein EYP12_08180, partial [Candidatus Bipolaricaulota bacterium]|nr:hypothetical protein [Candidatus Bipolaricaulota bacterium]